MLVKTYGSAVEGISAVTVTVEVNISQGVGYNLVGLPDNAVKESSHRINAAFETNGFRWPGKKITVNMAPADMRKEGASFDLRSPSASWPPRDKSRTNPPPTT